AEGHRVGSAMICAAADLPIPDYFLVADLQDAAQANGFWDKLPGHVSYSEYGTGDVSDAPFAWGTTPRGAAGAGDFEPVPVVYRDDIENGLRFAADIAASPLSDKDGRYVEFTDTNNYYFLGNRSGNA
ncbi:hypothetical protein, partial [Acidimangrovimonas sediminis]|uniref:hypothetical protein n=1 Tax=Acidimangrovimonas sediminis TaxID=2056283 RepID=UPI001304D1C2